MRKRRSSLIALLVLLCSIAMAQEELSYDAFIQNIKSNHPLMTRAKNIRDKGDLLYQSAKGGYDPIISAEYENKNFDEKLYYSSLQTKVKQPLYTSQYITAGYEFGTGSYLNPDLKTPSYGLPFVGIEASLLQGLTFDKRRAEILKSKKYRSYYEAEQNIQTNDLLFYASLSYFDWVYSCKELSLQRYFLTLAETRYNGIRALSNIGERASIDTIEANMLYQTRSLDLQSTQIDNQKKAATVQSLNWLRENEASKLNTTLKLRDSLEYYFDRVKGIYLNSFQNNAISNPVLSKYEANQEILKIEKRYKAELIKPKLDVKYNFLFNTLTNDGPALSISNYRWGANVSFPLLLRTARNDYKLSKIELSNNQLELDNKKNELNFKLNLTRQNISLLLEQLSNAERNLSYSKQLVTAEKLKFDNGESSLFLLNARENKWLESELKLAEYRLKFIKSVMEYIYLRGDQAYSL